MNIFVQNILDRMMQHQVQFEHLNNSVSVMHRDFTPYSQETFLALSKVIKDLVNESEHKIPAENFALLNKILSHEKVTTKVFDSAGQAKSILGRYLG